MEGYDDSHNPFNRWTKDEMKRRLIYDGVEIRDEQYRKNFELRKVCYELYVQKQRKIPRKVASVRTKSKDLLERAVKKLQNKWIFSHFKETVIFDVSKQKFEEQYADYDFYENEKVFSNKYDISYLSVFYPPSIDKFRNANSLIRISSVSNNLTENNLSMNDWDSNFGDLNTFYPPAPARFGKVGGMVEFPGRSPDNPLTISTASRRLAVSPSTSTKRESFLRQTPSQSPQFLILNRHDTLRISSNTVGTMKKETTNLLRLSPAVSVSPSPSLEEDDEFDDLADLECGYTASSVFDQKIMQYLNKPLQKPSWKAARSSIKSTHPRRYNNKSREYDAKYNYYETTTGRHCFIGMFILIFIIILIFLF